MYGDLEMDDHPLWIKATRKTENEIEFIVEWANRPDGSKPKDSVLTNTELKKRCPEVLL